MKNKKTHEQFLLDLQAANLKNNTQYQLLDNEIYQGTYTRLKFKCEKNHVFDGLPKNILRNNGCYQCGRDQTAQKNLNDDITFLSQLTNHNIEHPDKQVNLIGLYTGLNKKTEFECFNKGHKFLTTPKSILLGSGCSVCYQDSIDLTILKRGQEKTKKEQRSNEKKRTKYFKILEQLKQEHGESVKLDISVEEFSSTVKPVPFLCDQNHTWNAPIIRVLQGHKCPHCYGNAKKSNDLYLNQLKSNNRNVILLTPYVNASTLVTAKCNICNYERTVRPQTLLNNECPKCSKNKLYSEKALRWLEYVSITQAVNIIHAGNFSEFSIPKTRYKVDGFCKETNTIYEFYGDFWHGNPTKFDSNQYNDVTNCSFGQLYQHTIEREQKIKNRGFNIVTIWESEFHELLKTKIDLKVIDLLTTFDIKHNAMYTEDPFYVFDNKNFAIIFVCVSTGYNQMDLINLQHKISHETNNKRVICLFEDEWIQSKPLVIAKLSHYLQHSKQERIHARKCVIKQISLKEKRIILQENHLQGNDNAQIAYGAFYNNHLVSVMTFSKPRVALGSNSNKQIQPGNYELVRFVTDVKYRIPGIASRLLTAFCNENPWSCIYSFADKRWSIGNLYEKIGFTLTKTNRPNYYYVIDGQRKHRWNYRKDVIKNTLPNYDTTLTEYQNMQNHGYHRIWDCGTLKYTLTNAFN